MSPIRILQLISGVAIGDQSGGAELHAIQIASLLDRSKYEARIFAMRSFNSLQENLWLDRLSQRGIPVEGLLHWQGKVPSNLARVFKELRKTVRTYKPHIIHSHSERVDVLGMLIRLLHSPRPLAVRTVHLDQQWKTQPLVGSVLTRFLFPMIFNHETAVSQSIFDKLTANKIRSTKRVSLCYNGISAVEFGGNYRDLDDRGLPGIDMESPLLGVVGRLTAQKGHSVLLEAVARVKEEIQVQLLIIGDGPMAPQLEEQTSKLGMQNNVKFLGIRNDVLEILPRLDIFVLPSRWEGFPTVILEAMSKNIPVITSDIPGSRELVRNGDTGILIPANSPEALSKAILELLRNPEKAKQLADRAYTLAARFTIEEAATCYERIYTSLVDQKKPLTVEK